MFCSSFFVSYSFPEKKPSLPRDRKRRQGSRGLQAAQKLGLVVPPTLAAQLSQVEMMSVGGWKTRHQRPHLSTTSLECGKAEHTAKRCKNTVFIDNSKCACCGKTGHINNKYIYTVAGGLTRYRTATSLRGIGPSQTAPRAPRTPGSPEATL